MIFEMAKNTTIFRHYPLTLIGMSYERKKTAHP
jgi:hypothetical protein